MPTPSRPPSPSTVTPAPRRALRAGAGLAALLAILAAPAAARADGPPAPPAPPAAVVPLAVPAPTLAGVVAPPFVAAPIGPLPVNGGGMRMRSKGLWIGGIVTGVVGGLVVLGGAGLVVVGHMGPLIGGIGGCFDDPCFNAPTPGPPRWLTPLGGAVIAGGLSMIGGGVAMAVVGSREVPADPATSARPPAGVPVVALGPRAATLTWSF